MKWVNVFVFCGYVLAGTAFGAGLAFDMDRLVPAASFVGWFLCAYSATAYLVVSSLYASRGGDDFWATLYPVNFGLALLAFAMFAIDDDGRTLALMGISGAIGAALAYLGLRTHFLRHRVVPVAILLLLVILMFVEPVWGILKYVIVGTGILMLASFALSFVGSSGAIRPTA